MSGGMYGADVAQMRQLAQQFDAASQQLSGARTRVGEGIRISAWVGPVAVNFRAVWDTDASRRVAAAARALQDAAVSLRRNADEQDAASRADGGTAFGGTSSPTGGGGHAFPWADLYGTIKTLYSAHGLASDGAEYLKALQKIVDSGSSGVSGLNSIDDVLKNFKSVGGVASGVGFFFNAYDIGAAFVEGDTGGQVEAVLDTAAGVAGLFIPGAGLAWEGGKLIGTGIYQGVNTFYDSPGGAMAQGAQYMFGDDARLDTLTLEQQIQLAERYDGIGGFGLSIIDSLVGTTKDLGYWVGTKL